MKRRFWLIAIVLMLVLSMSLMLLVACDGGSKKDKDRDDEEEEERAPKLTEEEEIDLIKTTLDSGVKKLVVDAEHGNITPPSSPEDFVAIVDEYVSRELNAKLKKPSYIKTIKVGAKIFAVNKDGVETEIKYAEDSFVYGVFHGMQASFNSTKSGWKFAIDEDHTNEQIEKAKIAAATNEAANGVNCAINMLMMSAAEGVDFSSKYIADECNQMFIGCQYVSRIYIDFQADGTALITCVTNLLTSKQDSNNNYILVKPNLSETSDIVLVESGEGVVAKQGVLNLNGVNTGNLERIVLTYADGAWAGMQVESL